MVLHIFRVTLFMWFLSKQEEVEMDEETDQLELQMEKNSRMFHLNVGLAPNTVLSTLSGSLSSHTLTFLVIFLLVQTCGGEMTSFDLSPLKSNAAPSADPSVFSIFFTPAVLYPILAFAFAGTFILLACCAKKCKGIAQVTDVINEDERKEQLQRREEVRRDVIPGMTQQVTDAIKAQLQREEERRDVMMKQMKEKVDKMFGMTQQVMDAIKEQLPGEEERRDVMMKQMKEKDDKILDLVKKFSKCEEILQREASVVNALKEPKKLLENQKDQLKSQLEEVERKKMENKEKLLSVEKKITEAEGENKDKGGLLKEKENLTDVKWKLEEQKTTLKKLELNVEQVLQIIDALAGGDRVQ